MPCPDATATSDGRLESNGLDSCLVEAFYISLLVLIGLVTTWFAGYVVYKLFESQR